MKIVQAVFLLIYFSLFTFGFSYTITVDGDPSDWENNDGGYNYATSLSLHASGYFNGQWIYKGKTGDARDTNNENMDIWELRVGQDGTYLYILGKFNNITDINNPILAFAFSTGSSGTGNWIGDEANTFIENSPQIDFNVILHTGTANTPTAEFYDITGGSNWYTPNGVQVSISTSNNVIEARLPLSSLEISNGENFTFWSCTFLNQKTSTSNYWANDGDCTNDWGGSDSPDAVDGMTEGWTVDENWWNRAEFDDLNNDIENANGVTIIFNDAPLPVTLASFTAFRLNDHVTLKWTTESEIGNAGFEIERAIDQNENFTTISSYLQNPGLIGQGNSSKQHRYSFEDVRVAEGHEYWYKLVDVDVNGNRTFYGPIKVNFSKGIATISTQVPAQFRLYQNYPNPFNPTTILRFDVPRLSGDFQNSRLVIYNSLGEVVKSLFRGKIEPGSYEITWDGTSNSGVKLPSGVYYAKLSADYFSQSIKMIILK